MTSKAQVPKTTPTIAAVFNLRRDSLVVDVCETPREVAAPITEREVVLEREDVLKREEVLEWEVVFEREVVLEREIVLDREVMVERVMAVEIH